MLHYVAICEQAPNPESLRRLIDAFSQLRPHAATLNRQWFGFLPGFHRIHLSAGHVLLTMCIGGLKTMLREQHFTADAVFLGPLAASTAPRSFPSSEPAHWALKAVVRCCRRGTELILLHDANDRLRNDLVRLGFEFHTPVAPFQGHFNPGWNLSNSRGGRPGAHPVAVSPSRCVVIGAGLAGASVAASLARRGWEVQVLDAADAPAAGASGLPAGLAVPHNSPDNSPRSRLSRAGLRLTLEQARTALTPGQDFEERGTLERRLDGALGLPANWPLAGEEWSRTAVHESISADFSGPDKALWHAHGAWIKPARLVQTWLDEPGVRLVPRTRVNHLARTPQGWAVSDDSGRALATAPLVVVAAAGGSLTLLRHAQQISIDRPAGRLDSARELAGQVSWALHHSGDNAVFPETPVNGSGSFIPAVPVKDGLAWFAGATYEQLDSSNQQRASHQARHLENLRKLEALLPRAAAHLKQQFAGEEIQAWSGVRCATSDRLPVVDAVQGDGSASLWVSAAMGSRGLSLSMLCAELLAARLHAEPLPIESRLARLLQA
jgi:tRNA 5-methylaminomethyl-2-thiouridine biosynthesis bifunctional protein